jgi:hypothetical protein
MRKRRIKQLNNKYIIIIIYFLNFTYPLGCLRVPPGVLVPQVEYHWSSVSQEGGVVQLALRGT